MKKFSVKTIVAIGIGAALFFVLGRFVSIPSFIPNTNITTQYGLLAFLSVVFGPVAGALIGLIGHALIDFSYGWGIWWSWVIAPAVFGLLMTDNTINLRDMLRPQTLLAYARNLKSNESVRNLLFTELENLIQSAKLVTGGKSHE